MSDNNKACSVTGCSTCQVDYSMSDKVKENRREIVLWLVMAGFYIIFLVLSRTVTFIPDIAWDTLWLVMYVLAGRTVLASGVRSLLSGGVFDESLLMSVATVGALFIGAFPEAAAVMIFYQIGEALQERAVSKARAEISSLLSLRPEKAVRVEKDGSLTICLPSDLLVGDTVLISPGDRVPVDAAVIEGSSDVSSLVLSGESAPHPVDEGDSVFAGEINITGVLKARVEKVYADSALSRMLSIVEEASEKKARAERFFTRFARYYTPAVVLLAAFVAFFPPIFAGGSLYVWGYRALVLLVISCPCALLVGIPSAYVAGIATAAKKGIIIKGGTVIDLLASASSVVFDKTGTLTHGEFEVAEVYPKGKIEKDELLSYAASAERFSPHPLAKALVTAAKEKGLTFADSNAYAYNNRQSPSKKPYPSDTSQYFSEEQHRDTQNISSDISDNQDTLIRGEKDSSSKDSIKEIPGRGIEAMVNGKTILVGSDKLLHDRNIEHDTCLTGSGILHVSVDGEHAGHIWLRDRLRGESVAVLEELRKQGVGDTVVLTGDNSNAAMEALSRLGVDSWYAELLPEEKVLKLEEILGKNRRGSVIFVGDGINDAAALARADVGIAMGAKGAEAAIESADCVIMNDSLSAIPSAIDISRRTRRIVIQNIIGILAIKAAFLFAGSLGLARMWEAIIADVGVTLLAVLNSLRLFLKNK
ncbi:heavy metal translocating P-type ATPase [Spirochaetia bacterium 38H-sp]|uniref:P-type Zn(2+) transporter n=1 Tax=Rarispira pelagica TaxID=3141764 RepID=A0ABU9UBP7_9SPIR